MGKIALGKFARGKIALGKFALGKIALGKITLGKIALGKIALGKIALGRIALGRIALGKISLGKIALTVYESFAKKTCSMGKTAERVEADARQPRSAHGAPYNVGSRQWRKAIPPRGQLVRSLQSP